MVLPLNPLRALSWCDQLCVLFGKGTEVGNKPWVGKNGILEGLCSFSLPLALFPFAELGHARCVFGIISCLIRSLGSCLQV